MAEGGIGHQTDYQATKTASDPLDYHFPLQQCAICLEQLRQPKSLPCLHCFCLECLYTFITKKSTGHTSLATSFPCPVCRRTIEPPNPSDKRANWAGQFPTYTMVQNIMQLRQKTPSVLSCKLCKNNKKMDIPAEVWCESLSAFFCETCKVSVHDVIHDDCVTLVALRTDTELSQEAPAIFRCNKHQEKVDYLCEDHKILGCSKCIIADHRRCEEVALIEDYCDKITKNPEYYSLLKSLQAGADTINTFVSSFNEQVQLSARKENIALRSITELRQRMDHCLDNMQKKITYELIFAVNQEKRKLQAASQRCKGLSVSMLNTLDKLNAVTLESNNIETILLFLKGQTEVKACKDMVADMKKIHTIINIRHVIDPGMENVGKDSKLNIGKIVLEMQPKEQSDEHCVKEIGKFSIKLLSDEYNCCANGVLYLSNNHIVIGDCNNKKLKMFTDKGLYLAELKLEGNPWDLCVVDNDTIAVTVCYPGSVHVVKVKSSKLSLSYKLDGPNGKNCYGITHTSKSFIVTTPKEVYKITGDRKVSLLHTLKKDCYSLTSEPKLGSIFATQYTSLAGDTAVCRLSGHKEIAIMKVIIVKFAYGVDIDKEGNLFICGEGTHNVMQMSGDGTHISELLASSDGVSYPRAIAVCDEQFVVTNAGSQHNDVHIYQR